MKDPRCEFENYCFAESETLSSKLHCTIKHLENNLIYSHEKKVILKESGHERGSFLETTKRKNHCCKN